MHELINIKPREYQERIFENCKDKNCLVVLPTGIGKTLIALMLSVYTQKQFPATKTLFLAPTRPLAEQHLAYFKKHLPELFGELVLFTGKTESKKRKQLWETADIIFSTPQCIQNDVKNNIYNLEDVSLLIIDEAHRCLKNYSYTAIAEYYKQQAKNKKVLGLTASPGTDRKTIEQIARNLGIETIEIRTRESDDVKPYLKELEFKIIKIEFPAEFKEITTIIKKMYHKKIEELKNRKLLFEPPTKTNLLKLQGKIMAQLSSGNRNFNAMAGVSACAQAIKLSHLIELLETQTLYTVSNYLTSLFKQSSENKSRAVKQITKNPEFNQAYVKINELLSKNKEHPKLGELISLVEQSITKNPKNKIIIFSQYRDTVVKINKELNAIKGIHAKVFVGQAKKINSGLSQKEQHQIMNEFKEGKINIICATSIAEEGLDIPEVNTVIFYEPVPSAIRKIQRCLTGDTKILMDDGTYKEINKIKKYEKVISFNLKEKKFEPKNVTDIHERRKKEIIEIITEKNNVLRLTKEHPLLTENGWIKAENLKEKDRICLGHSIPINVKYNNIYDLLPEATYIHESHLFKQVIENNKLTFKKLENELKRENINANEKTLWGYANRDAVPINLFKAFLKITNFNEQDAINQIKYIKSRMGNILDISKINLSEFMWLVGIIASDGDLRKQSKIRANRKKPYHTYRFRISNQNPDIINKAERIMKNIGLRISKDNKRNTISSNNTIIGLILNKLGLPFGKKSKTLELSEEFFKQNDEGIGGFLSGLFDGDGNYNAKPCQIRIGTGSKKFAFQLQSILLRLGFLSKIEVFDKNEERIIKGKKAVFTGKFYSVELYQKRDVKRFLELKEIVKIRNKNINWRFTKNNDANLFYVKIKSIKKIGKEDVFNIEIDDNNNYIAENIIVHNCGRTARLMPGKTIILMTLDTLDEIFYYASRSREKRMYRTIDNIKKDMENGKFLINESIKDNNEKKNNESREEDNDKEKEDKNKQENDKIENEIKEEKEKQKRLF